MKILYRQLEETELCRGLFASACARLAPGIPEDPACIKILKFDG